MIAIIIPDLHIVNSSGAGASFPAELAMNSHHISLFIDYISKKKYSESHSKKLIRNVKKLSKSIYFFKYQEIRKLPNIYSLNDGMYKTLRILCHYYEESSQFNTVVVDEIAKIRKILKGPTKKADLYVPSHSEIESTLESLKTINTKVYNYYLCLLYSGARVNEIDYWHRNRDTLRVIQKDGYFKVEMNYQRGSKGCIYLYLPDFCKNLELTTGNYVTRMVQKYPDIIRPKYLRKFFYSKCLRLGVPAGIADFYQGRSARSIGDRHYLDKERMADESYMKIVQSTQK